MRVLIVSSDIEFSAYISNLISEKFIHTIYESYSHRHLARLFETMPSFDVIIFAKADELKVSITKEFYIDCTQLNIFDITNVESEIKKLSEIELQNDRKCSLKTSILWNYNFAPTDIFFKDMVGEFFKIFSKGDPIGHEAVKDIERKYRLLYIFYDDFNSFYNPMHLKADFLIPWSSQYNQQAYLLFNLFKDQVDLSIFTRKNFKHYDFYFIYALKLLLRVDNIYPKLKAYISSDKYCGRHSYCIGYMSSEILTKAGICDFEIHVLICVAAIIHDLEIPSYFANETELNSLLDQGALDTSPDIDKVLHHGENLIQKFPFLHEFPHYLIETLINHHERPGGGGFPKGKSCLGLEFFSAAFIFSHIICDQIEILLQEGLANKNHLSDKLDFKHGYVDSFIKCKIYFDNLKLLK
jgi:HD-GYP domain-containing protein (c-di-GMP phosphodiesterase class II)